ncbi:MAG: MBL fold metallo-hydrolase [Faecalibacterium sp.]|nr:MBL fold metallo-hydrolase [Ruminococcus sp.]MCM1484733.1 MBL fold metallo-hydrolase [Faecalibacterium sp.]
MARFCSLFSSSSGNSTFIGSSKTGILIDAGVSAKRMKNALLDRNIDPSAISAIFVTHEHSDHIKGIRIIASNYNIPVYATEGTLQGLEEAEILNGKFPFYVMPQEGVEIGDLFVKPFKTPHDSNESCGFTIELPDERKAAVATDIGHITNEIMNSIIGCDLVMLESNHDVGMLENGPYPYYLKRRILSDTGHLSNEVCADVASQLIERGTTRLFLGHLSTENNMPELAYQTSYAAIYETGAVLNRDYMLTVNPKENLEDVIRF